MTLKRIMGLTVLLAVIVFGAPAFSQTADDLNLDLPPEYQTELPQDTAREPAKPRERSGDGLVFLGPIFQILFYAILALAVGYILYGIATSLLEAKRARLPKAKPEDVPIPLYQPDKETAKVVLGDAEKLAAEGRYAEAVHVLLFRSIQDLENKRPHSVRRSLTSREISQLKILSDKAREAFATIGGLVERSFFGGRELGQSDYETSKDAYKAFAYEKITR